MPRAVALAALLVVACATTPPPPPAAAPPEPAVTARTVDFRRVFGGRASSSIYDPRLVGPDLMARVLLEASALDVDDADKGMEAWTLRRLLQAMGQRGSIVLAPPAPSCAGPPCYAAAPTAALRNLRFVSGRDTLGVRVHQEGPELRVSLRFDPKDESLCGPTFSLKVRVVQLAAQVQTLPDGAIAAVLQELTVVDPPAVERLELDLPDPLAAPEAFCAAIAAAYEETPGFASDDARFEDAARQVLDVGLSPLYPKPPLDPTPSAPAAPAGKAPRKAPSPKAPVEPSR